MLCTIRKFGGISKRRGEGKRCEMAELDEARAAVFSCSFGVSCINATIQFLYVHSDAQLNTLATLLINPHFGYTNVFA